MKDDNLDDNEFTELLLNKTRKLFPVLNSKDKEALLIPYLNSQASMVYEAVWWLTLSWNDTEGSGDTAMASSSLRRILVWIGILHACYSVDMVSRYRIVLSS